MFCVFRSWCKRGGFMLWRKLTPRAISYRILSRKGQASPGYRSFCRHTWWNSYQKHRARGSVPVSPHVVCKPRQCKSTELRVRKFPTARPNGKFPQTIFIWFLHGSSCPSCFRISLETSTWTCFYFFCCLTWTMWMTQQKSKDCRTVSHLTEDKIKHQKENNFLFFFPI